MAGDSEDDEPSLAHTNDLNQTTAQRNLKSANLRLPRSTSAPWPPADCDLEEEFDGREDGHDRELENEHGEDGHMGSSVDEEPRCPPNLSPVL